jgi:hypothetical protein
MGKPMGPFFKNGGCQLGGGHSWGIDKEYQSIILLELPMDFDSSDNSTAKYTGKVKSQTFKQFQLERLIKEGMVPLPDCFHQLKE